MPTYLCNFIFIFQYVQGLARLRELNTILVNYFICLFVIKKWIGVSEHQTRNKKLHFTLILSGSFIFFVIIWKAVCFLWLSYLVIIIIFWASLLLHSYHGTISPRSNNSIVLLYSYYILSLKLIVGVKYMFP